MPPDLLLTAMNRALTLVLAGQPTIVSMRDQRLDDLDPRDLGIDQVVVDVEELRLDEGPQLAERRTPNAERQSCAELTPAIMVPRRRNRHTLWMLPTKGFAVSDHAEVSSAGHIPGPDEPSVPELEVDETIPPRPEEEAPDVARAKPDVEDHSAHPA